MLDRGCRVAIVVDAIRPIDLSREAEILTEFVRGGAVLVLTAAVCDGRFE
jgi:hypothetical protein